jgi:hypothetical protein
VALPPDADDGSELVLRSVYRWEWNLEWFGTSQELRGVVAKFRSVNQLDVVYFETANLRGFCAPALGVCESYLRLPGSPPEFLDSRRFPPDKFDEAVLRDFVTYSTQQWDHKEALRKITESLKTDNSAGHTFDETTRDPIRVPQSMPNIHTKKLSVRIERRSGTAPASKVVTELVHAATDLANQRRKACGPGEVVIPRFSVEDPWVLVYFDGGANCDRGIMFLRQTNPGGWILDSVASGPDEIGSILLKINRKSPTIVKLAPVS